MQSNFLLKLKKLNHARCVLRYLNTEKFATLAFTNVKPQINLLNSISHNFWHKKRKFRKRTTNDLLKNYSTLHLTNSISDSFGLYLLPQYMATRGIKRTSYRSDINDTLSHLFVPVKFEADEIEGGVGEDIVGPLNKNQILPIINKFYADKDIKDLAKEQGLDQYLFQQTIVSFRKYCLDTQKLPTDLHIIFSDIIMNATHLHSLYPYFYKHAKDIFPHLSCMDDLYKVSDLTHPPNWYHEARAMNRKIVFHAGPTNSGKTYHAMEKFLSSESGVYCGPLKLLAVEVHEKSNDHGTPCDLITGEERKFAISDEFPASHVSCTVEMTSVTTNYDVAIIDEIQMIKDPLRGWAWTRAFLGICAKEVHLCGEASAIKLVKELAMSTGEEVEVHRYNRLTALHVEEKSLVSLDKVQPGDCIVCFSRHMLHKISQAIEKLGHEVAVIYGGLPPSTKLEQAKKFNDPNHPCKIMVATDAIGMGINLSIRRIIFSTLEKPNLNEEGKKEMETISVSSALQIAGRAGRYGTAFSEGFVTTMKSNDLPVLQELMKQTPAEIKQAGLHPTAEQIELFAYHLPNYTLSILIDIFIKISTVDSSQYFICTMDDFKFLANMIQHVQLPLRARYVFCCAPINTKLSFVCALFLKFARQFSKNEPATFHWLWREVNGPFTSPKTIHELVHLEAVFDVFDIYLWLSYRFPDLFPDAVMVRGLQHDLDLVIREGVAHITQLLKSSEMEKEKFIKAAKQLAPIVDDKNEEASNYPHVDMYRRLSLAESLVSRGIISQRTLKELESEFSKEIRDSINKDNERRKSRKGNENKKSRKRKI